jgi:hypothetical protein
LRQKYTPKCAAACRDGPGRKFCTAGTGTRADFVIDRLKGPLLDPATTSAPAAAPPSLRVECMEVQYQYDYLHLVISSPFALFRCRSPGVLFAARLAVPTTRNDASHGAELDC